MYRVSKKAIENLTLFQSPDYHVNDILAYMSHLATLGSKASEGDLEALYQYKKDSKDIPARFASKYVFNLKKLEDFCEKNKLRWGVFFSPSVEPHYGFEDMSGATSNVYKLDDLLREQLSLHNINPYHIRGL